MAHLILHICSSLPLEICAASHSSCLIIQTINSNYHWPISENVFLRLLRRRKARLTGQCGTNRLTREHLLPSTASLQQYCLRYFLHASQSLSWLKSITVLQKPHCGWSICLVLCHTSHREFGAESDHPNITGWECFAATHPSHRLGQDQQLCPKFHCHSPKHCTHFTTKMLLQKSWNQIVPNSEILVLPGTIVLNKAQ